MKGKWKIVLAAAVFMFGVCMAGQVQASELYGVNTETNTYTIHAKSGNITEAVREALDEMETSAKRPGTLVIKPGEYKIGLILLTKPYVTISAEDAKLTFTGSTAYGQYMVKGSGSATTGVTIDGGTWNGAKKASRIFTFDSAAKGMTIKNCTVTNARDCNIRITGSKNVELDHVLISSATYGISVKKSSDITIKDSLINSCKTGVELRYMKGENLLQNCTVSQCTKVGMQIKDNTTVVTMIGGGCTNGGAGISLTTGAKLTADGVDISNNKSNGISPVGTKQKRTVLNISNSTFNNNGRHGVAGAYYVEINAKNCVMNGNTRNGLLMRDYCISPQGLINITTSSNGISGILINGYSTCKKIVGCTANKNKSHGMMLVDLSTTIEKATIEENKKCGIYMSAKAKKNVSISKSKISGNQAYGVFVGGNNTLTVKNTTVEKSKLSGIEGNSGIIKVTGKASCIQNNGKYGICIRKPGKLYISGGKIANNKNCGVVYYGSTGYCKNADIRGNLTGVMVAAGARLSDLSGNTFTDNKSYGAAVYLNPAGATTTVQKCKKNTFHDPKATMELMYWSGTSVPSSLNRMAPVSIDNQVKAKKSLVNGTATPGGSITVSVSGKKYRAQNVTNAGTFAVKVKALKKGNRVTVTYTDKNQNKIIAEKAL